MSDKTLFNIQFVSEVTGINVHTLRMWEKRYQAVVPARNDKKRRTFSQEEINKLTLLKELTDMGNAISGIANLSTEELQKMKDKYAPVHSNLDEAVEEVDYEQILNHLLMALSVFKIDIINHELGKLSANLHTKDFALKLVIPLMKAVGVKVMNNELTIGQEHSLSSILKFHLTKFLYSGEKSDDSKEKKTIIVTTPEGEMHEFGILISALLCNYHNHNLVYLGPNMPVEALKTTCEQLEADIVLIGISQFMAQEHLEDTTEYIRILRTIMPENSELWVGGHLNINNAKIKFIPSLTELDKLL